MSIVVTSHFEVPESSGYVKICVEADHQSQTTYEVILSTVDDTAIGKADHYLGV